MRKGRLGTLVGLCCGLILAGGAFAADETVTAEDLKATIDRLNARLEKLEAEKTKEAEMLTQAPAAKTEGLVDSILKKIQPRFGGDANIEWDTRDSNQGDGLTSRVRLTMDADIEEWLYLHTRLTAKQYITGHESDDEERFSQVAGYENEAIAVGMEQLYFGAKFRNSELRVGRQPLWLANGLLADINGINGLMLRSSLLGVKALGFYGRSGTHNLRNNQKSGDDTYYQAVELSRAFGPVEIGATYLEVPEASKPYDGAYYGANASFRLPFNTLLWGQYVVNDSADDDDKGYRIGVNYGNAAKKGEWDASLSWVHVEDTINPNQKWFVNDGNWVGAEGVRIKAHYALTDRQTIVLVQDFFDNINSGDRQNRTDIEWEIRF